MHNAMHLKEYDGCGEHAPKAGKQYDCNVEGVGQRVLVFGYHRRHKATSREDWTRHCGTPSQGGHDRVIWYGWRDIQNMTFYRPADVLSWSPLGR